MVGSTLHRHDNVHRQLAAFAELLRRVQSHYASDQLHQMLCAVSVGVPNVSRRPHQHGSHWTTHVLCAVSVGVPNVPPRPYQQRNRRTTHSAQQRTCDVSSLSQLRSLINGLRSGRPRRGGIQREEQRAIVGYFDRFFDDLDRLRELKRYFHERIYACLYDHYYQPDSDNSTSSASTTVPDGSDNSGRPLATVLDQSDNDAPSSLDGRPLSEIVHQLWTLNRDWDLVLSAEEKDVVEIDDEPRTDEERFVKITSIVPNWVEFGFKALQLAKIWWTTANRIYSRRSPPVNHEGLATNGSGVVQPPRPEDSEENDEVASVMEEVTTLDDCAYQICIELESLREEIKQVRNHGERVEALYKKLLEATEESRTCGIYIKLKLTKQQKNCCTRSSKAHRVKSNIQTTVEEQHKTKRNNVQDAHRSTKRTKSFKYAKKSKLAKYIEENRRNTVQEAQRSMKMIKYFTDTYKPQLAK